MPTHDPTVMVYSHKSNKKHKHSTRNGIRYFNHWFAVYKCPVCNQTASHKQQPIMCRGTPRALPPSDDESQKGKKVARG